MNDKKKKPRKNSAGVLSQNKVTNMKFVDFKFTPARYRINYEVINGN